MKYNYLVNAKFLAQPMSGVQRFAAEISLELAKEREDILFLSPKNIIHEDIAAKLPLKKIGVNKGTIWEQVDLPLFLWGKKIPLLCLANTAPLFYSKYLVCHHDITYIRYPETLSRKARLWYSLLMPKVIKNAKKVVTVSEFSKKDISLYYALDEKKVDVVYNSVPSSFVKLNKKNNKSNYFLMVSSLNLHKNIDFVIRAFDDVKSEGMSLKVVGDVSHMFSRNNKENTGNVEYLGRVSDSDLTSLYQNARGFIFPSLYEGFGIPPLEAQALGCPVLASNAASIPEILKDSALYFSPYDEQDFLDKIQMMLSQDSIKDELVLKGQENVKRFSWQSSTKKLLSIIDTLNANGGWR